MTQRKYRPGPAIRDIGEVVRLLYEGRWFYLPISPNQPKHPSILISMTLNTLWHSASTGRLRLAVKTNNESGKGTNPWLRVEQAGRQLKRLLARLG